MYIPNVVDPGLLGERFWVIIYHAGLAHRLELSGSSTVWFKHVIYDVFLQH